MTVAIILGLGLTDILRSLGEQFRARDEIEVAWLQVGASCLLLVIILSYLWGFWLASDVTWTLPLFLLQTASAIALALSAQFLKVNLSSTKSLEAQYFDNGTATYIVWAMGPVFSLLFAIAAGIAGAIDFSRIVPATLLISLGLIKNRTYHAVVLISLLSLLIVLAPFVTFLDLR